MMDYHAHKPGPSGGFLCAVRRSDWDRVAAAQDMIPCFGIHPWYAAEAPAAQIAYDLDEYLCRFPQAQVGETGLDATPRHRETLNAQEILLQVHLGAAFRHERLAQLHGAGAWARLLELLRQRDHDRTLPRVLLHAWNGSHELAREFLSLGALFSVGVRELSHPKAAERYARIPADRLFAESDDDPESFPRAVGLLTMLRGDIRTPHRKS